MKTLSWAVRQIVAGVIDGILWLVFEIGGEFFDTLVFLSENKFRLMGGCTIFGLAIWALLTIPFGIAVLAILGGSILVFFLLIGGVWLAISWVETDCFTILKRMGLEE